MLILISIQKFCESLQVGLFSLGLSPGLEISHNRIMQVRLMSNVHWNKHTKNNLLSPQAEFYINQTPESCLGILNNMYNDSVTWVGRKHPIYLFIRSTSYLSFSTILVRTVIRRNMTFITHLFSACYHRERFICEDSEILLKEVFGNKEENVKT